MTYGFRRKSDQPRDWMTEQLPRIQNMGEQELAREAVILLADPPKTQLGEKRRQTFREVADITDPERREEVTAVVSRAFRELDIMNALDDRGRTWFLGRLSRRDIRETYASSEPWKTAERYLNYGVGDEGLVAEVKALSPDAKAARMEVLDIMLRYTFVRALQEQVLDEGREMSLRSESLRRMTAMPDDLRRRLGFNLAQRDIPHGKYRARVLEVLSWRPKDGGNASPITPEEEHAIFRTIVDREYHPAYETILGYLTYGCKEAPGDAIGVFEGVYGWARRRYAECGQENGEDRRRMLLDRPIKLQEACTESLAYYLDQPGGVKLLAEIRERSDSDKAKKLALTMLSVVDQVDYAGDRLAEGRRILGMVKQAA